MTGRKRLYGVFYKELPYGGIGKDKIFAKSKAALLEEYKQYSHIEILQVVFLGWHNPS